MRRHVFVLFLSIAWAAPVDARARKPPDWARAAAAIEDGDFPAALLTLGSDAKTLSGPVTYLFGRALEGAGQHAAAARAYARSIRSLPALADEIFVRQGEGHLAAKDMPRAADAFDLALRRLKSQPSPFAKRALVGAVRSRARRGRCEGAERLCAQTASALEIRAPSDALLAVARCYERAGNLARAAEHFDRIAAFRFKSEAAKHAQRALADLAQRGVRAAPLPVPDGLRAVRLFRSAKRLEEATTRLATLGPDGAAQQRYVRFEKAELLHAAGDHGGAAREHRALFDEKPRDAGAEGFLRMSARCLREGGDLARAGETLLEADKVPRGAARNGRDLFRAAELFQEAGDAGRAAKLWLELARRERGHRDAPKAYVRAIEALIDRKPKEARRVADRWPRTWARRRIAWRVRWLGAWAAFRADDPQDAARRLARIEAARRAPAFDRDRARFWRIRVADRSNAKPARAHYRSFAAQAPHSFYADLGAARLRALGDSSAPAPKTLAPDPGAAMADAPRPERKRPAKVSANAARALKALVRKRGRDLPQLARAAALAALELVRESTDALDDAQAEVERARHRPRRRAAFANANAGATLTDRQRARRGRLRRIDRAAFALALVPILRGLGAHDRAADLRARFGRAAEGREARRNAGSHPRPYADLLHLAARAHGVPDELLFAIMRRESAYRTDALSVVGARGLMQVMPRTGRRIAARLRETLAPGALDAPAVSLRYGAWYLRELLVKYRGQLPLAIAAYNAGPKAVSRWLDAARARAGTQPIAADVFLEEIPYTETRRYVRKVMKSMRTYAQILRGQPTAYVPVSLDPSYGDNIDF